MLSPQRNMGCVAQFRADNLTVSRGCAEMTEIWGFLLTMERTRAAALADGPLSASPLSGEWVRVREEGVPVLC